MRVDLYSKAVLTVIAVCLLWLTLGGSGLLPTPAAQAQAQTNRVFLSGWVDAGGFEHRFMESHGDQNNSPLPVVVVNK